MLQARSESAVVDLDGRMYVMGGYPGDRIPSDAVQVWDSRTDQWELGPPLPMPLHHMMAATVNGKLYAIGGEFGGAGSGLPDVYLDGVYELHPQVGEWVPRASMPTARSAGGTAVIGGKIYVAGGRPPRGSDFAVYDPTADAWQVLPELPTQRNHLAVAAIDGRVYVAGGRFGAGFDSEKTAALEIYDPTSNQWTSGAPLPMPRGGVAGVEANGCLFVIGGEGNYADPRGGFNENEAYDPARTRGRACRRFRRRPTGWSCARTPPAGSPGPRRRKASRRWWSRFARRTRTAWLEPCQRSARPAFRSRSASRRCSSAPRPAVRSRSTSGCPAAGGSPRSARP
jgi:N-acetylneuraminic acid mutarotase